MQDSLNGLMEVRMNYYENNALEFYERTINSDMSENCNRFIKYIPSASIILDCGCGSGRDQLYFKNMGFQIEGLEPSKKLAELARETSGCVIHESTIQDFKPLKKYDAIWACASLLHLQKDEVLYFFKNIDSWLKKEGYIYVSGKSGIKTGLAEDGRFFLEFNENLLSEILINNRSLKLIDKWYSNDVTGRADFKWMNFILKLK